MSEQVLDEWQIGLKQKRSELELCQKEKEVTSCLKCDKLLACELRDAYIKDNTIYRENVEYHILRKNYEMWFIIHLTLIIHDLKTKIFFFRFFYKHSFFNKIS